MGAEPRDTGGFAARRSFRFAGSVAAATAIVACNAISGIGDFQSIANADDAGEDEDTGAVTPDDLDASTPDTDRPGDEDASSGDEDAVVPPDGPTEPDTKRVFVTSTGMTGNMGGIGAADAFCQTAATNAGLSGNWIAWLSTSQQEAIDRITHTGRYVLVDGREVVANKTQLATAALTNPILVTELGTPFSSTPGDKDIWTGTNASVGDGSGSSCNDWTSSVSTVFGTRGNAASTSVPEWTKVPGFLNGGWGCQVNHSFYCFER